MISFENLSELQTLTQEEKEYFEELKRDIEESLDEELEVAFTVADFCLVARIFDFGKYFFIYPVALSERADEEAALLKLNEYAMREEIERVFADVPKECVPLFLENFRHLDIDAENPDQESFRVKIKTECELLDEIPSYNFDKISLGALLDSDVSIYAKLIRDEKTNEFWGYDYKEDFSELVSDSFFIENARMEFLRGAALTLAVRLDGEFIGEATLYAFDGKGDAEIAIRLLPEASGRGLGKLTFNALAEYARRIGLVSLSAFVDKRNAPSLKYCASLMEKREETPSRVKFSRDLF
jgi:RimJ/RimL family protein N-acetyltransferase